ncbi:MAG: F0F1 ATP synthase subunit A [Desulfobacterales bacterium]
MEELGRIKQLIVPFFGHDMTFNIGVIIMTWAIFGFLLLFGYLASKNRRIIPGPVQVMGELFINQLYGLTEDAMDEELGKKYGPLICALFMFLLVSNWCGMLPFMEEPTKDLNTPLSMGLMGFVIAHFAGIRAKGLKGYIKEYFEPMFFMMPLDLIGELAKVVSISFRLFGNIMGGSIIVLVVSHLVYSVLLRRF